MPNVRIQNFTKVMMVNVKLRKVNITKACLSTNKNYIENTEQINKIFKRIKGNLV